MERRAPSTERLVVRWLVAKLDCEWWRDQGVWASLLAEFGFLSAAAEQRQVAPVSCASLAEGWRSALWTCLPLLFVGWVSVSWLAVMGCHLLVAMLSLLHPDQ